MGLYIHITSKRLKLTLIGLIVAHMILAFAIAAVVYIVVGGRLHDRMLNGMDSPDEPYIPGRPTKAQKAIIAEQMNIFYTIMCVILTHAIFLIGTLADSYWMVFSHLLIHAASLPISIVLAVGYTAWIAFSAILTVPLVGITAVYVTRLARDRERYRIHRMGGPSSVISPSLMTSASSSAAASPEVHFYSKDRPPTMLTMMPRKELPTVPYPVAAADGPADTSGYEMRYLRRDPYYESPYGFN